MRSISACWLATIEVERSTTTSFEERSSAASAISTAPLWCAIISSRNITSAARPSRPAAPRSARVSRARASVSPGACVACGRRAVVRGVPGAALRGAGHPGHRRLGARLREIPLGEPSVHLAGLLRLRRRDVVAEQSHVGVVGEVADDHRELDALLVVHLHVAREAGLGARVGRRGLGEGRQAADRERRDRDETMATAAATMTAMRAPRLMRWCSCASVLIVRREASARRLRIVLVPVGHETLPGASTAPVQSAPGSGTFWLCQYSSRNCGDARVVGVFDLQLGVPAAQHDRRGQALERREHDVGGGQLRLQRLEVGVAEARVVGDPDRAVLERVHGVLVGHRLGRRRRSSARRGCARRRRAGSAGSRRRPRRGPTCSRTSRRPRPSAPSPPAAYLAACGVSTIEVISRPTTTTAADRCRPRCAMRRLRATAPRGGGTPRACAGARRRAAA